MQLAETIGFGMVAGAGWTPTVDNYLGRVTKAHILRAVREARAISRPSLSITEEAGHGARSARLLDGSGWLPEVLRILPMQSPRRSGFRAADDAVAIYDNDAEPGEVELPTFLTEDVDAADTPPILTRTKAGISKPPAINHD